MNRKSNQVSLENYGYAPISRPVTKPIRVKTASGKTLYLQGVRKEDEQVASDAPKPKREPRLTHNQQTCLALAVVVFAVGCLYWAYPAAGVSTYSVAASNYDAGMACTMAEEMITPQLKAPTSAEFDYGDCRDSAVQNGHTWTLHSYIDADNSFGAHIRTRYTVQMRYDNPPSNMWHMENLTFSDN